MLPNSEQVLFNQVQEKLAANKNKFKPDEWKGHSYPQTELLICGECGKPLGGKSAHGKNKKHFYYGHPRQINSDGISHLKRCQLERVRAERIEDIVLRGLKTLLQKPEVLEHWLEIYAKNANTEVPALEGRMKSLDADIQTNETRIKNLVARIADLPPEIEADAFYDQIKELKTKIAGLKSAREELQTKTKTKVMNGKTIDRQAFEKKITRTIANLEKVPVEERKPIYQNVLKFAELPPKKIVIGLYASTKGVEGPDSLKATGADGIDFSNFKKSEPKRHLSRLTSLATSGGSTTVTIGAPRPMLREPLSLDIAYPIQWHESRVNLTELAKLRYIHGWSRQELAHHYGRTLNTITNYCQSIRRKNFDLDGLTVQEKEQIIWAYQN